MALQKTIKDECTIEGTGFIYDRATRVILQPSLAGSGVTFIRTDMPNSPAIPAQPRFQMSVEHCTTLKSGEAVVSVVEHLLSACSVLGVTNLRVLVDGPELPTCDGSALPWGQKMLEAGLMEQDAVAPSIVLRHPLVVTGKYGSAIIALPSDCRACSYLLNYENDPEIGCSYVTVDLDDKSLVETLLPARTFITEESARAAIESGTIHSTNESLGLVIRKGCPPELRMPGELARHKILDILGDLFILGKTVQAQFIGIKSGHKLNAQMVRELAARYP